MTAHPIDAFREKFNQDSQARIEHDAQELREYLIGLAFHAVQSLAQLDLVTREQAKIGDEVKVHIEDERNAGPVEETGSSRRTLVFMVQDGEGDGAERISVHTPVAEEDNTSTLEAIRQIAPPDRIFIIRSHLEGNQDLPYERCVIRQDKVYGYEEFDEEAGVQRTEGHDLDPDSLRRFSQRVDSRVPDLSQIDEDLTNWTLVPHRTYIKQPPHIEQ